MILYGKAGAQELLRRLTKRTEEDRQEIAVQVRLILSDVKARGDQALFDYALRFESTDYDKTPLLVTQTEIDDAYAACDTRQIEAIRLACTRLQAYHKMQMETGYTIKEHGAQLTQIVRPLNRVGIYAPGGTACYPSSVLMNAVPAKVAGVPEILLATPAKGGTISPLILIAAREAGVTAVYRMGGAQAVAAFAYGTATVPKVDKITGPGNSYVALAKKEVFGTVGIDAIAGPSEVVILADELANARFIAADMLAQAEHDKSAAAVCITTSEPLAKRVETELAKQCAAARRTDIITASLERYGAVVVMDTMAACIDLVNDIAPEHLECLTKDPAAILPEIRNAGGVFLGEYTPEALGDYVAGSNHVLPTNGTARFSSPLGVYDFIKRMSVLSFDKEALAELNDAIQVFSDAEGLQAHGRSAAIRFEQERD